MRSRAAWSRSAATVSSGQISSRTNVRIQSSLASNSGSVEKSHAITDLRSNLHVVAEQYKATALAVKAVATLLHEMARAADTRERLIAAAEELFAANGIQAVSLREIVRASGARNTAALQYHFGDRAGLVRAILEKHDLDVDIRRDTLLDAYEAAGERDLWTLANALVQPLGAQLAEPDGGPAYLQILAELMNQPQQALDSALLEDSAGSMLRWRALV